MGTVLGYVLIVAVVVFTVFQIKGLVQDFKSRKKRKSVKNNSEQSETDNK